MPQRSRARYRFRPAGPADIKEINRVALSAKAYWNYSAELMRIFERELKWTAPELQDERTYTGLALLNVPAVPDRVCGFFRVEQIVPDDGRIEPGNERKNDCELGALFVDPAFIGKGLGSMLLQQACETGRAWGYNSLRVESDPHAEPFYLAMGAVRIGSKASISIPERKLPLLRLPIPPVV